MYICTKLTNLKIKICTTSFNDQTFKKCWFRTTLDIGILQLYELRNSYVFYKYIKPHLLLPPQLYNVYQSSQPKCNLLRLFVLKSCPSSQLWDHTNILNRDVKRQETFSPKRINYCNLYFQLPFWKRKGTTSHWDIWNMFHSVVHK